MSQVARRLGLLDVFAIGVNAIVGSGVFSIPDDMQRSMGGWSPLAFLLCAVVLLPVALCFAELAGSSDRSGGPYLYALRAFGPRVGFFVGWSSYLNAFVSFAANATLFVELVGFSGLGARLAVIGVVGLLGAINYVGIRPGALVVRLMVIGKILAILCFVVAAVGHVDPSRLGGPLPEGASGVANGIYLALFPLQGFEVVPVPAGETRDPERSVPIGTVGSLLFAAALFVIVQAVLASSYDDIALVSGTPLVDAAKRLGPTIGMIVLVGSIVSVGGFTAGSALGSPRYAQAMAEHGQLPSALASVHARFGTPHLAIALTTAVTAGLGSLYTYRELVGFSNVMVVLQYGLTCLAVPVLRRREPGAKSSYRVPFGPVLPILGALGSLALLSGANRAEAVFAAIALAIGAAVLVAIERLGRSRR